MLSSKRPSISSVYNFCLTYKCMLTLLSFRFNVTMKACLALPPWQCCLGVAHHECISKGLYVNIGMGGRG